MSVFSSSNQPETRGAGGQKRHKIIRDALMLAMEREVEVEGKPTKRIVMMAEAIAQKAAAGDIAAFTAVADRIDGKPKQQIEHSGDAENPVAVAISVAAASLAAKLGAK